MILMTVDAEIKSLYNQVNTNLFIISTYLFYSFLFLYLSLFSLSLYFITLSLSYKKSLKEIQIFLT